MNMSSYRKPDYGRYSMNLAVSTMEQERLQGWLSVASVEGGQFVCVHIFVLILVKCTHLGKGHLRLLSLYT